MCGIFGFQVRPGHKITEYESSLISFVLSSEMESRGRDSFGGVSIPMAEDADKAAIINRGLGKISENGQQILYNASHAKCFLGHTRTATKGEVTIENCHPFRVGDILGVHNGTVQNWAELDKKYNRNCDVDSMHVFAHLNDGLPFHDLYGYGTFFWLRASENWSKIYFAKTVNGSLSVANLYRDPKTPINSKEEPFLIIWASEHHAISRVAHLLNVAYHSVYLEPEKIHTIEEGIIGRTEEPFKFGGYYTQTSRNTGGKESTFEMFPWGGMAGLDEYPETQSQGPKCHINDKKGKKGPKIIFNGKKMTRKEKKAWRKRQQQIKKNWSEDPIPENICSGYGLEKNYLPINGQNGQATTHFLCPTCKCYLDDHLWAWCPNNGVEDTACKGQADEGCQVPASVCSDCGHYLLEGIHEESGGVYYKMVECKVCKNYCAPESMIVDADLKEEQKQSDKEMAEALADAADLQDEGDTKPTEIIIPAKQKLLTGKDLDLAVERMKELNAH